MSLLKVTKVYDHHILVCQPHHLQYHIGFLWESWRVTKPSTLHTLSEPHWNLKKIQPPKWYLGSQPQIRTFEGEQKAKPAQAKKRAERKPDELEDINWEAPSKKKRTWEKISGPKKANTHEEVRPQALNDQEQAVKLTDKQVERILQ